MSQAIVGRAQDGMFMVGDGAGGRVWLDLDAARFVRDELVRLIEAEAARITSGLSVADFKEPA